jgi:hypothetical protein
MRHYDGNVTELADNQVFVFGSNLDGFHGAGSAGFASFNVFGNRWREFEYSSKPNGWKGKWNVKGVGEGFQEGTIGKSYALPTVTKAGMKRSRTPTEIKTSIKKLYDFAEQNPTWEFLVAQDDKMGLNGYHPHEMCSMFNAHEIPDNMYFKFQFFQLFYLLTI